MARRRQPRAGRTFPLTRIESVGGGVQMGVDHARIPTELIIERARDLRPFYERLIELGVWQRADDFQRDDRFRGGFGRPDADGKVRNWGPGYGPHGRMGRVKRQLVRRSSRPYHPVPTDESVEWIVAASLRYLATGELP